MRRTFVTRKNINNVARLLHRFERTIRQTNARTLPSHREYVVRPQRLDPHLHLVCHTPHSTRKPKFPLLQTLQTRLKSETLPSYANLTDRSKTRAFPRHGAEGRQARSRHATDTAKLLQLP